MKTGRIFTEVIPSTTNVNSIKKENVFGVVALVFIPTEWKIRFFFFAVPPK